MDFPSDEKVQELQALAKQKRADKVKKIEQDEADKIEAERIASLPSRPPSPPKPPAPLTFEDLPDDVDELKRQVLQLSLELEQMKDKYLTNNNDSNLLDVKIVKADGIFGFETELPAWIEKHQNNMDLVALDESFLSEEYRETNRFKGKDYLHTPNLSTPIVSDNKLYEPPDFQNNALWPRVEGVVRFNSECEQQKGWVHRGALCALMDDAANWAGFCVNGTCDIFSGFTKRVDVMLKRPVRVGSVLKLTGEAMFVKNRTDVHVNCKLIDPSYNETVHCEAECVFVMNERAAERLEELVARKQKNRGNSGGDAKRGFNVDVGWNSGGGSGDSGETDSDPVFRPPNRVGRYGLGMKIDDELAEQIDEKVARNYIPKSGKLVQNAEKSAIKKEKMRQLEEAERIAAEEAAKRKSGKSQIKHGWESPFSR